MEITGRFWLPIMKNCPKGFHRYLLIIFNYDDMRSLKRHVTLFVFVNFPFKILNYKLYNYLFWTVVASTL